MKIRLTVDLRRPNIEGKYPLKLSFSNMGKTSLVGLNIYILENELDVYNNILLITNETPKHKKIEFQRLNSYIKNEMERAFSLLHSLQMQGRHNISPSRFKDLFLSDNSTESLTFNAYFSGFLKKKEGRTYEIYRDTLNKIEKKYGNNIYFDDITLAWLENFDKSMRKDGLSTNGRSIHFRNIRAVFNDAINHDAIGQQLYPFRKFKIKNEKTRKRSLSVERLIKLFDYSGEPHLEWARDVAKIIFFLIGINVKDLYNLSEINAGYMDYRRSKTSSLYSIKVEPEIKDLITKYRGEDKLFNFSQTMACKSFGIRINKHLRTIGKELGIERLTTYYLRHTWATIASELDIPKETISAALGHSQSSVTDIYIDFNRKKIDEANRKVIDYIYDTREKRQKLSLIINSLLYK
ncbi:MAG: site-specific integrase [Prevotella sp.]|jgi:integrase|nr:site-specific integrase [Prevotella sp.]